MISSWPDSRPRELRTLRRRTPPARPGSRSRELTHNPQVLEKLHALADEAGIIPGAAKALRFLSGPEPVPMRRLAQDLHCDNSYITTIVDSLEVAGVARREAHPTDRRIKVIVLTDAGRRLAALAASSWAPRLVHLTH